MRQKGYVFSIFVFMLFLVVFIAAVANLKSEYVAQESNYGSIASLKASGVWKNAEDVLLTPGVNCTTAASAITSAKMPFSIEIDCSGAKPAVSVNSQDCSAVFGATQPRCACTPTIVDCGTGLGKKCGLWPDGCGGFVDCDPCDTGQHCDANNICVDNTAACNGDGTCGPGEDISTCPSDCHCGNAVIDSNEDCDPGPPLQLNGEDCTTQGYTSGTLSCDSNCAFDTSACTLRCDSDNVVDSGEQCDGTNLSGQTCLTQGYASGTLSCDSNCQFNYGACSTLLPGYWTTNGTSAKCNTGYAISNYDCINNCSNPTSRAYCRQLPAGVTWATNKQTTTTASKAPYCSPGYIAIGFDCRSLLGAGNCGTNAKMKLVCRKLTNALIGATTWTAITGGQHNCSSSYSNKFDCGADCKQPTMRVQCAPVTKK